jgi:hypothetical protein
MCFPVTCSKCGELQRGRVMALGPSGECHSPRVMLQPPDAAPETRRATGGACRWRRNGSTAPHQGAPRGLRR